MKQPAHSRSWGSLVSLQGTLSQSHGLWKALPSPPKSQVGERAQSPLESSSLPS